MELLNLPTCLPLRMDPEIGCAIGWEYMHRSVPSSLLRQQRSLVVNP